MSLWHLNDIHGPCSQSFSGIGRRLSQFWHKLEREPLSILALLAGLNISGDLLSHVIEPKISVDDDPCLRNS